MARRKLLLPKELDYELNELTGLVEEVSGILLYRQKGKDCPLEAMFITGVGNENNIQSIPQRVNIANKFFQRNPIYQCVEFHTHPKGTIQEYGKYYAKHFSQGDIGTIKEQLRQDGDYIAMLVTPKTKLLLGIDNPKLKIVGHLPRYARRDRSVSEEIRTIARNLGYDLGNNLPVTRFR